ncbi:hypothetical protein ACPBLP_24945, partial [Escherichia coli]
MAIAAIESTLARDADNLSKIWALDNVQRFISVANTELFNEIKNIVNRPGFPGEYFICELRLPDHRFRWKHNKLFLLLPEEYGPAFPA